MEGTRSGRTRKTSYSRRKDTEQINYKKSIILLQIMICIGIFTAVLLIKTIDSSVTDEIKTKIKTILSENMSIENLYNSVTQKLETINLTNEQKSISDQPDLESQAETDSSKKNDNQQKLVPTPIE